MHLIHWKVIPVSEYQHIINEYSRAVKKMPTERAKNERNGKDRKLRAELFYSPAVVGRNIVRVLHWFIVMAVTPHFKLRFKLAAGRYVKANRAHGDIAPISVKLNLKTRAAGRSAVFRVVGICNCLEWLKFILKMRSSLLFIARNVATGPSYIKHY